MLRRLIPCLFLLVACGCSGRDFGWTTDLWGDPYPPDPTEIDERYAELQPLQVEAESLRLHWTKVAELERLCTIYEELLAASQSRINAKLEVYYEGLSPSEQEKFGPPKMLPDEDADSFAARSMARRSALREAANLPFDKELYDNFWKLGISYYILSERIPDNSEEIDRKLELYQQGLESCERAMACFKSFRDAIARGEAEEEAAKTIGKEGIEGVYWTVICMSKWSRLKGFSYVLFNKNRGWEMIQHVRSLDNTWYYGAADRYLGAFYAVAPSIAGGDMEKSWEHFMASLEVAPDYFATHVLISEYYATKVQDKELFLKHLDIVLNGDPAVYPDIIPYQRVEQEKARKLLDGIEDYF